MMAFQVGVGRWRVQKFFLSEDSKIFFSFLFCGVGVGGRNLLIN